VNPNSLIHGERLYIGRGEKSCHRASLKEGKTKMKKLIMLAMVLGLLISGCASIPANFNERATSELKIDIKLFSKSTYLPAEYGFSGLKSNILSYHPQPKNGVLVCSDDRVLFIVAGREKYDVVVEIKYSDVVDVSVPAWGASRRLVVKCKSQFYTFEVIDRVSINRENTYNFYRFIATKAGIEIKIPEPKKSEAPPNEADAK